MADIRKLFFSYNQLSRNIFLFLVNKENHSHEFVEFLLKYILVDEKENKPVGQQRKIKKPSECSASKIEKIQEICQELKRKNKSRSLQELIDNVQRSLGCQNHYRIKSTKKKTLLILNRCESCQNHCNYLLRRN